MSNPRKLRPKYTTHVTGAGYWPTHRPSPTTVAQRLKDGESLKIFGIRRIGKSSLMQETARLLRGQKRLVIDLDGQKLHSIPAFLRQIVTQLPQDKGPLHHLIEWVRGAGLPPELRLKAEALLTQKLIGTSELDIDTYAELLFGELGAALGAMPPNTRPILVIDELPWFCDNAMQAEPQAQQPALAARLNNLLATLRAWRSEQIGVAMLIGGSLAMSWLEREHRILSHHINDCLPLPYEELTRPEATEMVAAMIVHQEPEGWDADIAVRLVDMLPALYPGVIQCAFAEIRYERDVKSATFAESYAARIADTLEKAYLSQFDVRSTHFTPAEWQAAHALFTALLESPATPVPWEAAERLLSGDNSAQSRTMLTRLMEEGFIDASRAGGVRFASGLAHAWFRGPA